MKTEEFNIQVQRLISNYGRANYSDERSKLIWQEVRDLDAKWFASAVSSFIFEMKYAPLGPDFREAIEKERNRQWAIKKKNFVTAEKEELKNPMCPQCSDTGSILAKSKLKPSGFYAFRCSCETAKAKNTSYPLWENASDEFERYA